MRELRSNRGLSQKELANLAGISQQEVSGIETGAMELSGYAAKHLAPILGEEVLGMAVSDSPNLPDGYLDLRKAASTTRGNHTENSLRRLCFIDRIPGALKLRTRGKLQWFVPGNFTVIQSSIGPNMSERKKNNIARAYIGGATGRELSDKYDIHPSYPRQLLNRGYPKVK